MNYPDGVIITGAGRGLGKELALSLAKEDVFVLCISKTNNCYITADKINRTGGRAIGIQADISNPVFTFPTVYNWCQSHKDYKLGVVLNAGILGEKGGILNSQLADWGETIKTNLLGNLTVLQAALPNMLSSNFGRVVCLAGGGAANARPMFSGYSLSKTAMVREVENISEELKDKENFSIIALAPGAMETEMLEQAISSGEQQGKVVDIQEPVSFIKNFLSMDSKEAKFLSGKFIHVRDDLKSEDFKNKWLLRRIEQ